LAYPRPSWRRTVAAALALLALLAPAAADVRAQSDAQRIAAVVNDDVITSQDLLGRLNLALATSGLPNDEASRRRLAPQVLRGFVDEKLQLQEAERLGLSVTDAEIDQALDTIAQRNGIGRDDLVRYLQARNVDPRTLRDQLRAQIAWIKVVQREVRPRITVSQEQVDLALRRDAAEGGVEVLLSEILLPVYERGQEATVLAQAQELVASLRGGTDFAALASQVSSSASSDNRGDLGWVRTATLAPELRERIMVLQPGQVSDPIVGPNGVQIFQVRDRRVQAADGPAERARVRQSLEQEQLERQASRYLRDLRRDAFVDVRL